MFRKTFLAALLGAFVTVPAVAQDAPPIKSIDVEVSLTDLNTAEAAAYWKSLDTDLEAAIAAQLVGRLGDEGMDLRINMHEVELASFLEAQTGAAESKLSGMVNVVDMTNNTNFNTFGLTVTMNQALPYLQPGTDILVIPRTSPEVYAAMVAAFAAATVDRIDG